MALGDPPPSFDDVIYEQHLECMHEAMHIAQKVQQHGVRYTKIFCPHCQKKYGKVLNLQGI